MAGLALQIQVAAEAVVEITRGLVVLEVQVLSSIVMLVLSAVLAEQSRRREVIHIIHSLHQEHLQLNLLWHTLQK